MATWVDVDRVANMTGISLDADNKTDYGIDVDTLVDEVKSFIQQYTGRDIERTTYTETHDGGDIRYLFPKQVPIISVTHLKDSDDTLEKDSDYYVYDHYILLVVETWGDQNFKDLIPHQNLELKYEAGYDPFPAEIQQIATEMTVNLLLRIDKQYREGKPINLSSLTIGNYTEEWWNPNESGEGASPMHALVQQLDKWKRMPKVLAV